MTPAEAVRDAKRLAGTPGLDWPMYAVAAGVLAHEVDRLEAQLDSVRAELAATAAHIAAWDEALDACLPALHEQMEPRAREAGL